ncbi:gas vesicle protein [Streptomyces ziwulingensis]|uniref:Gas vesicle protein GVPa n=1 Tax=Streptomyces ziwulingensis TaxID=1045501 RepID=A0ABP9BWZ4_9ACTN
MQPAAARRGPSTPALSVTGAPPLRPSRDGDGGLAHVIETLLDKGLVLNADIMVSVAGVELLGIRLRAALASFETAARYGLEFPSGTDTETAAWREAREEKETCPQCGKRAPTGQLLNQWCPWCGWRSAHSLLQEGTGERAVLQRDADPDRIDDGDDDAHAGEAADDTNADADTDTDTGTDADEKETERGGSGPA